MIRSLFETEDSPEEGKESHAQKGEIVADPAAAAEPLSIFADPAAPTPVFPESAGTAEAESPSAELTGDPLFAKSTESYEISPKDDLILELEPFTEQPEDFRRLEQKLAAVERELKAEREIGRGRSSPEPGSAIPLKMEDRTETPVLAALDRTRQSAHERTPLEFESSFDNETTIDPIDRQAEEMAEPAIFRRGAQADSTDPGSSAKTAEHFHWTPNVPTILDSGTATVSPDDPEYKRESTAEIIRQSGLAWTAATVLFGSVAFLMIIGWFADLLLESSPWGVVCGIVVGSIIGFFEFFRLTAQILKK